jgi:hypothetical protein
MNQSVAHSGSCKFSQDEAATVRAELLSIQTSDSFSSSKRCQDFLEFVVEHALAGDYETLTERFLGVELFGRAIDYETATDSIVRVRANDVRRRLGQYYSRQRIPGEVRIDLVAGGYIPVFHWSAVNNQESISEVENTSSGKRDISLNAVQKHGTALKSEGYETGQDSGRTRRRLTVAIWSAIAITLIAVTSLSLTLRPTASNFDRFWQPVLDAPSSPVLSLPTTDTLQLTMDSMRTINPLNQLKPGEFLKINHSNVIGFHDWHVSLPVLQATLSVALALQRKGKVPLVRIGTDLRRDELRGHPIIAIGSFSNPWTEQNVSGLRFTFGRGVSDRDPPRIRDSFNPKRSWSLPHTYPERQDKDYAIITRTFDPITREPFVSLAGLHSFGNQIAGEFVSQESSWNELARRAPSGWEKMNLQILLEANVIGTTPESPKILDVYFWK